MENNSKPQPETKPRTFRRGAVISAAVLIIAAVYFAVWRGSGENPPYGGDIAEKGISAAEKETMEINELPAPPSISEPENTITPEQKPPPEDEPPEAADIQAESDTPSEALPALPPNLDWLIEPVYEFIYNTADKIAAARKDGKDGVINYDNEVIIPFEFESISRFYGGIAVAEINNRQNALIDEKGNILTGEFYDEIYYFGQEELICVRNGGKYGLIDKAGNPAAPDISDEFINLSNGGDRIKTGDKYGYIDAEGKIIIPPIYGYLEYGFNDGLIAAGKGEYPYEIGFLDEKGGEAVPFIYSACLYNRPVVFENGIAAVRKGDKYGCIDTTGKTAVSFEYDFISPFYDGAAHVIIDDKSGVVNQNGDIIIPIIYDSLGYSHPGDYGYTGVRFKGGLIEARKGAYSGAVDKNGKEVIPIIYDYILISVSEDPAYSYVYAEKDGVGTVFDTAGNEKFISSYYFIGDFRDGLAVVMAVGERASFGFSNARVNKYGYIDADGAEAIPLIYNLAGDFDGGFATVNIGDKYGVIDKTGAEVIPVKYDVIMRYKNNRFVGIKSGGKWGLLNYGGEVLLPVIFEELNVPDGETGGVWAKWGGKWGYINLDS